jgi:hypothetical protein
MTPTTTTSATATDTTEIGSYSHEVFFSTTIQETENQYFIMKLLK